MLKTYQTNWQFFRTNLFPLNISFSFENQQNYFNKQKRPQLECSNFSPMLLLPKIDKICVLTQIWIFTEILNQSCSDSLAR